MASGLSTSNLDTSTRASYSIFSPIRLVTTRHRLPNQQAAIFKPMPNSDLPLVSIGGRLSWIARSNSSQFIPLALSMIAKVFALGSWTISISSVGSVPVVLPMSCLCSK